MSAPEAATVEPPRGEEPIRNKEDRLKWRQILDGARKVFLADGFDAASMNEIARAARVSKGTLYVYFTNKEDLFEALIRDEKARQAERICTFKDDDHDVEAVLTHLGTSLLDTMMRPSSIAHLRIVLAVAGKFPQIGRAFYEAGPRFGIERLSRYLKKQVEAGTLAIEDTELAAMQFLDLCQTGHLKRMVFCVEDRPSDDAIAKHVAAAVKTFLRAYSKA